MLVTEGLLLVKELIVWDQTADWGSEFVTVEVSVYFWRLVRQ